MAFLIALGYSAMEIQKIALETKFSDLVDIQPTLIWSKTTGIDSGNLVRQFLKAKLEEKGMTEATTFRELKAAKSMDLLVVAVNLLTRKIQDFSAATTPDTPIALAVSASMSLPPIFEPVMIDGVPYFDGGMIDNFPITRFRPEEVLGLRLVASSVYASGLGYFNHVVKISHLVADLLLWYTLPEESRRRTVSIDCGTISGFETNVESVRSVLFKAGESAAEMCVHAWKNGTANPTVNLHEEFLDCSPQIRHILKDF